MNLIYLKKFINSFLYPRFLYGLIINETSYFKILQNNKPKSFLKKIFYFYPTIIESYTWAKGGKNEYRDPTHFIKLRIGLDDVFINYFVKNISHKDKTLDLGCNSGRHLNSLNNKGYKNLYGVDIMEKAFQHFKKEFPETFKVVNLEKNFIQRYLINTNSNFYDTLYTIGATIELIHPSFDVIGQMCRVTKKNIIILIQPDAHNYPRYYQLEFLRHGFVKHMEKKLGKDHFLFHFINRSQ